VSSESTPLTGTPATSKAGTPFALPVSIPVPTLVGLASLFVAAALQVLGPASWAGVGLAAVAALLLGLDRRFGPLGGGLIVLLALPYGRAADGLAVQLANLPVRPADAAVAVAVLVTLARWRTFVGWRTIAVNDRAPLLLLGAVLGLGVMALVIGIAVGQDPRDIGRDLRWWLLYGALGLAIVLGSTRAQLFSAFRIGTTIFALVVVTTAVLPAFTDGLKHGVLVYDLGLLRMQFGNSVFLLPVIGFVAYGILQRPRAIDVALLALLSGTVVLSLTRTSILTMAGMIGLMIVVAYLLPELRGRRPRVRQALLVVVTTAVAGAAAIGLAVVGTPAKASGPIIPGNPAVAVSPLDRVLFQDAGTNLNATVSEQGGRFATYRNAVALIAKSPIVGHGFGSLVAVPFAYDATRAATLDMQPGVDDAYLTIAMKAGLLGVIAFTLLLAYAVRMVISDRGERAWLLPAWAAIVVLTITQSFAVSNYGPFALALFIGLSIRGYADSRGATAASQV
jgi:hypothetical protein